MFNRRTGGPLCWLSLLHLITNWSGPQTLSGVPMVPSVGWWLSLPYLVSDFSGPQLADFLSPPSYIIVQSPTQSPTQSLDGMFDRHQAEITVMQFRGHSLLVHQSMRVSWASTSSHFDSQICLRDFFRLLAIGMCHFFPVHHFEMACLARSKVNIQQLYQLSKFLRRGLVIFIIKGFRTIVNKDEDNSRKPLMIKFIISISSRLILFPCFFFWGGGSWVSRLKLECVLCTHASYMPSNTLCRSFFFDLLFVFVTIFQVSVLMSSSYSSVDWGCRIHRLHLWYIQPIIGNTLRKNQDGFPINFSMTLYNLTIH